MIKSESLYIGKIFLVLLLYQLFLNSLAVNTDVSVYLCDFVYLRFLYFEAKLLGAYRFYHYVKPFSSFSFPVCLFGVFFSCIYFQTLFGVSLINSILLNAGFLSSLVLHFHWKVQSIYICLYHQWLLIYLDIFIIVCAFYLFFLFVSFNFSLLIDESASSCTVLSPGVVWEHLLFWPFF